MATFIQASSLPLYLSEDGVTYKQLVCLTQYNIPVVTTVTKTETLNCGVAVGLGAIDFSPAGTAVCEQNPTVSQVTYEEMLAWQINKTALWFKVQFPSPASTSTNIFLGGQLYVVNTDLQLNTNDVIKFGFTLNGFGELDNVA